MNGMTMIVPAGGAVSDNRLRRLMKLAMIAAGSRLSVSIVHFRGADRLTEKLRMYRGDGRILLGI